MFTSYFLITLALLLIIISRQAHTVSSMRFMTAVMAISMTAGFCIGAVAAILFQGDLFLSTVISSAAASVAGFLAGIRHGNVCAAEGMFSGLMAAMMMVMLAEMVPGKDAYNLLFLSTMLFVITAAAVLTKIRLSFSRSSGVYITAMIWTIAAFILLIRAEAALPEDGDDHHKTEEYHVFVSPRL